MKRQNSKYYILAFALCFLVITGISQELPKGYKVTMEMNADEKGDIVVNATTKYNAQYWDYVKQIKGIEPSVMKNNLKKQFPKYQLTDFDIKSDDMERTSNVKFKILGSLKLKGNGKWVADLETKNPDITKVSGNQFLLVDEATAQTIKIILPGSASGAKIEKDAFGKAILTYTAPVSGGGFGNILKYLGFLVAAGGVFLFFKNRKSNTAVITNPAHQKIDYRQTRQIDDAVVVGQSGKEKNQSGAVREKDDEK
jgi:hypothetical protein